MAETVHKGSCACGQVRIAASGAPYRVGVCHCLTCRKAHGAPFNFYAVYPPEAVTVSGEVITFASSDNNFWCVKKKFPSHDIWCCIRI